MSKFELLCRSLKTVREDFNAYREECFLFAADLCDNLRQYLEAPEGHVSLYANRGDFAGRKMDGPAAAMKLEDDAFWHFGIAVDLYEEPGTLPFHCVAFDMRLKKTEDVFELHVDDDTRFRFHSDKPNDLDSFHEHIFQLIMRRYEGSFREFISSGDGSRRFGF